jgi:signal transduction histidine kinase
MTSLPRFLAFALFVVLAALVALLAGPAWRVTTAGTAPEAMTPAASATAPAPAHRMVALSQKLAFTLAATSALLALLLIVSLALRNRATGDSHPPLSAARTEIGALTKLAESSAAQNAELSRERDNRRRAEEDAEIKQQLLAQSFEEKIRLGHDLHDGIIQSLYALGLNIESVRTLVKSDPDEAERRLDQTRAALNATIRDVRAYITGLTPRNLRRASFSHAVRSLLTESLVGHEAKFDINIDDEAAALLTPEQSIEALQIAREAVSNALRHGRATQVTLRMHKSDREVCLLVQDNGSGFDASRRRPGGHGMGNMQARAERLGATLRITSAPGEGSRVLATLPIAHTAAV